MFKYAHLKPVAFYNNGQQERYEVNGYLCCNSSASVCTCPRNSPVCEVQIARSQKPAIRDIDDKALAKRIAELEAEIDPLHKERYRRVLLSVLHQIRDLSVKAKKE